MVSQLSPRLTVIIPTKDRPEGLRVAVKSAIDACARAGDGSSNIIVVDDHGEVPAEATLSDLVSSKLKVISNHRTTGPSGARNCGVEASTSDIVAFLDDDDAMVPDYISRIPSMWESRPNPIPTFGFCAVERDGKTLGPSAASAHVLNTSNLGERLFALSSGVWVSREVFLRIGELDEKIRVNEDTDFCITMAKNGHFPYYDPKSGILLDAGRTPKTDTDAPSITKQARASERAANFQRILEKHSMFLQDYPDVRNSFSARVAKYLARDGRFLDALKYSLGLPSGKTSAILQAISGTLSKGR